MSNSKLRAFTLKASKGLLRSLITPVQIIVPGACNACVAKALWDIGATRSAISNSLATKLELVPTGKIEVDTANGTTIQNMHTLDIMLPNQIFFRDIEATEFTGTNNEFDAIIGMDIITRGDLSLTNYRKKTCLSFRIPSAHQLDYTSS